MAAGLAFCPSAALPQALPTGGHYVAGQGAIAAQGSSMTINQSTLRGIINWQGFSIGAANAVRFNNGSGATLNRVTGAQMSQIEGLLSATGSLYLINPNGIVIGKNGQVVTGGGFVGSTRDEPDSAFMAGVTQTLTGSSPGMVINEGKISAANGDAVLVGRAVTNSGSISAPNGTAALAAGDQVVLRPVSGPAGIYVAPGSSGDVTNQGTIAAASAALAAAGGNVYALAADQGGAVQATGVKNVNGQVWLTAPQGNVDITGTVTAKNADGTGGQVVAAGQSVTVGSTANISAAGASGGSVAIGAAQNATPAGAIAESSVTTIADGARIAAGGPGGGGDIETSGRSFSLGAASINAGAGGSWVIDPTDLTIDASAASTIDTSLGLGNNVTELTSNGSGSGVGDINIDSAISWGTGATLTLTAYHSINVDAAIAASGDGKLVLTTNNNSGGTSSGGALNFSNGNIALTGNNAALTINGVAYTLIQSANELQSVGSSGNYALAENIDASGLSSFTPIGESSAFNGTFNGLGNTVSNLSVSTNDSYAGLFGNSSGTIANLTLANVTVTSTGSGGYIGGLIGLNNGAINNVNVTGTLTASTATYLGGLVGYNNGSITGATAGDSVNGGGGNSYVGGLIGLNNATLKNVSASGAVNGATAEYLGGLIGYNNGTLTTGSASGAVIGGNGNSQVGGLIGLNNAQLSDVSASGAVTASTAQYLGGLIGNNENTVTNASATGAVSGGTGNSEVGGLIGLNNAQLTGVSATGNVTASTAEYLGGLIGNNENTITNAYARGAVTGGKGNSDVGGLIGLNQATLNVVDATGSVSSNNGKNIGGLIGFNNNSVTNAYATGAVSGGNGNSSVGGLVGSNQGTVRYVYAAGLVSNGAKYVGGLIGSNDGTVTDGYWDTESTGQSTSAGGTPETTSFLQGGLPTGFSSSIWGQIKNLTYPYFQYEYDYKTPDVIEGTLYQSEGGATASGGVPVAALVDGNAVLSTETGANGTYYGLLASGTTAADESVLVYTNGQGSQPAAASLADNVASNNITINLDLIGNTFHVETASANWSTVQANLTTAEGGNSTATGIVNGLANLRVDALGAFTIDRTMAAPAGAGGSVIVAAAGNLTIGSQGSVTGDNGVTLATAGNFGNDNGASAITVGNGAQWLIYSSNPNSDSDGGLSPNFIQYNASYPTTDSIGATIAYGGGTTPKGTGNGFLYSVAPTLTLASVTKTYDATAALPTSATAYSLSGAEAGDSVTLSTSGITGSYASANAGTGLDVNVSGLSIASATRDGVPVYGYSIASVASQPIGTIDPALVTIAANAENKTYGTNDPTLTYTATGLIGDPTAAGNLSRADYGTQAGENVGTYNIGLGNLNYGSNYTVALANNGAALSITPASVTVAANDATKTYGVNDPTLTYTASGLVGGKTVDGITLASDPTAIGGLTRQDYGTVAGEQVGSYGIGLDHLSYGSNYTVVLANNGAALNITKASVTVAANDATKVAGTSDPAFTYASTGLVGGTAVDGVTLASDTVTGALSRRPGEGTGTYAITLGDLSYGANYALALADNGADLTITPAPVANNIVIQPQLTPTNLQSAPANGGGVELVAAGNSFAPLPAIVSTVSTSGAGGGQIIVANGDFGSQGSGGGGTPAFTPGSTSLGGDVIFENGNSPAAGGGNGGGTPQGGGGFSTAPGAAPLGGNALFENGNSPSPQNGDNGTSQNNNGGSASNSGFGSTPTGDATFGNGNSPSAQNGNSGASQNDNGGSSSNNNDGNSSSKRLGF